MAVTTQKLAFADYLAYDDGSGTRYDDQVFMGSDVVQSSTEHLVALLGVDDPTFARLFILR